MNNSNIKLRFLVSLLFFFFLASPAVHAGTKVTRILEKVVENHKQFTAGMSVPYQREILTKSMAMLEDDMGFDKASGVFFFKGPDFLKVQQDTPGREFVISNGKSIWWYVPAEKTAYRYDNMEKELSILSMIFMGLKNPEDNFDVTTTESADADEHILTLTPKESLEEIDQIDVAVSDKDYKITRVEILDIAGNLTRFKLGEFERKKDIDDSFFDFKVPDDVKVIEEK
ncbi:MAG: outer membrane lipoprotein carrier protein LolA [Desulfobacteraceae bacterium]|jgi:outer membrane lipoprotein-sorting protein